MLIRVFFMCVMLAGTLACGNMNMGSRIRTLDVPFEVHTIDRMYGSMLGPYSNKYHGLIDLVEPELLWIRGYRIEVTGPDRKNPVSPEYLCHANVQIDSHRHRAIFGDSRRSQRDTRLFTLSQGQLSVNLPDGFGIPVMSTELIQFHSMVLNHNEPADTFLITTVGHIDFIRNRDLKRPLNPLFSTAVGAMALVSGDVPYFDETNPDTEKHGPGCMAGIDVSNDIYKDKLGREFTGHWIVEPGIQTNRSLVTRFMKIPYNTTIHFIAVHLHPFAQSLELRDITAGKSLYKANAENFVDRKGLANVDYYSSFEGIPVFKGHEYEVISVYNNTTKNNVDAMGSMFLYLLDKDFKSFES